MVFPTRPNRLKPPDYKLAKCNFPNFPTCILQLSGIWTRETDLRGFTRKHLLDSPASISRPQSAQIAIWKFSIFRFFGFVTFFEALADPLPDRFTQSRLGFEHFNTFPKQILNASARQGGTQFHPELQTAYVKWYLRTPWNPTSSCGCSKMPLRGDNGSQSIRNGVTLRVPMILWCVVSTHWICISVLCMIHFRDRSEP